MFRRSNKATIHYQIKNCQNSNDFIKLNIMILTTQAKTANFQFGQTIFSYRKVINWKFYFLNLVWGLHIFLIGINKENILQR